ncbi:tail fiber assembly protein [Citrobacter amalonaticus]|uniref:Tail fiber assembly protein n=1 Tax=Citrobacter amalonaticus TaxID=35703 RepID=A0A8I0SWC1_CITAM|nr:tail fiber assembly protein [Citrobacter amalonaticus]MBE0128201.1 tail fiber assembly protein [Citrobacter amalonaticus]
MNKYKWSAKYNAFFPIEMLPAYQSSWDDLSDLIDIDDAVEAEFNGEPPEGKVRGVVDGMPAWVDVPLPTYEEKIADAEAMKLSLKDNADSEIAWRQDAVDAGIATNEETAALAEWKKYRVLLMRVDTAKPVWPTPPVTG